MFFLFFALPPKKNSSAVSECQSGVFGVTQVAQQDAERQKFIVEKAFFDNGV